MFLCFHANVLILALRNFISPCSIGYGIEDPMRTLALGYSTFKGTSFTSYSLVPSTYCAPCFNWYPCHRIVEDFIEVL